jgi:uncharacterized protein (TIGR04255 family)
MINCRDWSEVELERSRMMKLPDYAKPPVVEVAIGVQFAPLAGLTAAQLGLYWTTIRDTFPRVEEQTPIAHMVEPPEAASEPVMALQFSDRPDFPRTWFLDATGGRLLQIQRDRFLHNWRRMAPGDAYPRFPTVRDSFFQYWSGFTSFLAQNDLKPQPDQYDLTYVNHIRKGDGWEALADMHRLFSTFVWKTRTAFLPVPDNIRWSLRFLLPNGMGRLHVDLVPVRIPPDNEAAIRFVLTARGRPQGELNEHTMAGWFELAREWIVRGFADLVQPQTDLLWERKV